MIGDILIESAIRASLLGLGVAGILRLTGMRSERYERLAWIGVLTIAAALPLLIPLAVSVAPRPSSISLPSTMIAWLQPEAASGWAVSRAAIYTLYLSVALGLLARTGIGVLRIRRCWNLATPLPELTRNRIEVRASTVLTTPAATTRGILVPADWSRWPAETLTWVLAHEWSHVVRRDAAWQLTARVYRAIFWFNPLSWWLERRMALLSELLSDNDALSAIERRADYAELLLAFARRPAYSLHTMSMARRSDLARRIQRIIQPVEPGTLSAASIATAWASAAIVVALAIGGPWFRVHTTAQPAFDRLPPLEPLTQRLAPLPPLRLDPTPSSGTR